MATGTYSEEQTDDASALTPAKANERLVHNRTARTLSIRAHSGRVTIPPLGTARVDLGNVDIADLEAAQAADLLQHVGPDEKPKINTGYIVAPLGAAFFCGVFATSDAYDSGEQLAWGAAAVVCLGIAAVTAVLSFRTLHAAIEALISIPRRLRELLYLAVVSLMVIAVPGAILYFRWDIPELLDRAAEFDVRLVLIGIGVQFVTIVGASVLPVLLYFVFDREKLKTLRDKFERHVFRLDPAVHTRGDVEFKYGQLLDEAYGKRSEERLLPGARSPILLATGVMTLGWTIALLDPGIRGTEPQISFTALLTPQPTAATYAFLGAYFFALNHVMRGYVRGDLRPKTYAQVAARTFGVIVLAFVLERLMVIAGGTAGSPTVLVLAFIAGIVPETVLIRLQDFLRGLTRTRWSRRAFGRVAPLYETDPLTQLEGIDIYDRARLMDEGITNVEGLAHHDLVELLLKTRIPASRLVDWVDQAILYIHCPGDEEEDEGEGHPSVRRRLRCYGIRTASDLEEAHEAAKRRGTEKQFLTIIDREPGKPPVLRVILDAIHDEDWMENLRYWHAHQAAPKLLRVPEDIMEPWQPPAMLSALPRVS